MLTVADFEESEYRGSLYNQLATSQYVWEPGQVFENYIGIDYALFCAHPFISKLYGTSLPLRGAQLWRFDLAFIWSRRKKRKRLPPYNFNMFIQAKRPHYGRSAPKNLKTYGLGSPYWRFETTPHQQVALESLAAKLANKGLVTYAAPAFHRDRDLYRYTAARTIVEHSTFPEVQKLIKHKAFNYSAPGAAGVVNEEPEAINGESLAERIERIAHLDQPETRWNDELNELVGAVIEVVRQCDEALQARFTDAINVLDAALSDFDFGPTRQTAIRQFFKILFFCDLFRLSWFVLGSAQIGSGPKGANDLEFSH